ncbi:fimbria/pilus chaperone family protein [Collimonas humicola]|uniref:fimbria/pilus chaperone family protein n=1 Tax=Collimonas humicola TaxID=2825886 RepID=UPI001B8BE8FC|nr:fimbria/pilus chaperone family protein [Collimonas humicola]
MFGLNHFRKRPIKQRFSHFILVGTALSGLSYSMMLPAHASLDLESSVVIVNQKDGEGSIGLRNTSSEPLLLHSEIIDIPEDISDVLFVAPSITRVEPGDTQIVRFILKDDANLKVERLKRVSFEGIPYAEPNVVRVTIRQNIPLIIRPAQLPPNSEPWKLLKWENAAGQIAVENTGPYVVRMGAEIQVQPSGDGIFLPRNYILPGERVVLRSQQFYPEIRKILFRPASVNGYLLDNQEALVVEGQVAGR